MPGAPMTDARTTGARPCLCGGFPWFNVAYAGSFGPRPLPRPLPRPSIAEVRPMIASDVGIEAIA